MEVEQYERLQWTYTAATFRFCFVCVLIAALFSEHLLLLAADKWLLAVVAQVAMWVAGGVLGGLLYDLKQARNAVRAANKQLFG